MTAFDRWRRRCRRAVPSGPLNWAAYYGNVPAVRALLKSGVDVDMSHHDCTPLHCAAQEGQTPVVKALIEAGADVESRGH